MRHEPLPFPSKRAAFRHAGLLACFSLVYALGAYVSLTASPSRGSVALFWVPGGVALGLVYLRGMSLLAGVWLAVLAVNLYLGSNFSLAFMFALCNTAGVAVAVYPLRSRGGFQPGLKRFHDVLLFAGGAFLGSAVGGTLAALALRLNGELSGFFETAFHWGLAELLSFVAFAPFYLTNFSGPWFKRHWPFRRAIEFIVLTSTVFFFGAMVFLGHPDDLGRYSRIAILLPVLLWAGLRFNPRVLSAFLKVLAIAAILGALFGRGVFSSESVIASLVEVQVYFVVFGISSLLIGSISYERATLARERENHLRNIANAIPELVWTSDPEGRVTFLNEQSRDYFGPEEVSAYAPWGAVLHPSDAALSEAAWQNGLRA
ncbi:MAG: hypothetical protein EOP11_20520, partial [Proteobacteria bacterium]